MAPVPSDHSRSIRSPGPISPEALDAAVGRFKKAIIERALGGELTHHLGYAPSGDKPDDAPTAPWKTAKNAVSHCVHTLRTFRRE